MCCRRLAEQSIQPRRKRERFDIVRVGFQCNIEKTARSRKLLLIDELARLVERGTAELHGFFAVLVDARDDRIVHRRRRVARFRPERRSGCFVALSRVCVGEIFVQCGGFGFKLERLLQMFDRFAVAPLLQFDAAEKCVQRRVVGRRLQSVEQYFARAFEIARACQCIGQPITDRRITFVERERGFEIAARVGLAFLLMRDDAVHVKPTLIFRSKLRRVIESNRRGIGEAVAEIQGADLGVRRRERIADQIDTHFVECGDSIVDFLHAFRRKFGRVGFRHWFHECLGMSAADAEEHQQTRNV